MQKYVSLSGHMLRAGIWSMDKNVFDKLFPDPQQALLASGKDPEDYEWKFVQDDQAKSLTFFQSVLPRLTPFDPPNRSTDSHDTQWAALTVVFHFSINRIGFFAFDTRR